MALPSIRSIAQSSNSLTCGKPVGIADGDVLYADMIDEGNHTLTPPSGWTQIDNIQDSQTTLRHATFQKIITNAAGEPGSYSWTITGRTYTEIIIRAVLGADTTTPTNAHGLNGTSGSSTTPHAPSITTTVDDCLLLEGVNDWFGKDWSTAQNSYSADSGETYSGALDLGTWHKSAGVAGSYGGETITYGNSGSPHTCSLIAVAPPTTSGAITAQAGVGIGVNANLTVQTSQAVSAAAGLGIGVNAPNVTVQTSYSIQAQAGVGIGVSQNILVKTSQAVSAQAGVGIGVAQAILVQQTYQVVTQAGLGIGVARNILVSTSYAIGLSAGLGIGVMFNATLSGNQNQIAAQPGVGIGVAANILVQQSYAIVAQANVGYGVAQNALVQQHYRIVALAGLAIGVMANATLQGSTVVPSSTPVGAGSVATPAGAASGSTPTGSASSSGPVGNGS